MSLPPMSGCPMDSYKRDFSGDHRERKDYALGAVTGLSKFEHPSQSILAQLLRVERENLPNALGETTGNPQRRRYEAVTADGYGVAKRGRVRAQGGRPRLAVGSNSSFEQLDRAVRSICMSFLVSHSIYGLTNCAPIAFSGITAERSVSRLFSIFPLSSF
jgi:hypothetical protein